MNVTPESAQAALTAQCEDSDRCEALLEIEIRRIYADPEELIEIAFAETTELNGPFAAWAESRSAEDANRLAEALLDLVEERALKNCLLPVDEEGPSKCWQVERRISRHDGLTDAQVEQGFKDLAGSIERREGV